MSVFLMGVYDRSCDKFRTVAKCGNGHDDATIMKLQKELDVTKISKVATGLLPPPLSPPTHTHTHTKAPFRYIWWQC